MSAENQTLLENPLVKGGLYFVGILVAAGISIGFVSEALLLAK